MSIQGVMKKAANKIKPAIRRELRRQGHYLSGTLESSISDEVVSSNNSTQIKGTALYYARFVRDGFPASSASWKQFPFLISYFRQRGLPENEAKSAAAATIRKWMKEGMPTESSKRFSKTGQRKYFIDAVEKAISNDINQIILDGIRKEISKEFHKTKSETI